MSEVTLPGFVDHHGHILEVALLTGELREFQEGPAAYHRRLAAQGTTPMDNLPLTALPSDAASKLTRAMTEAADAGLVQISEAGLPDWAIWHELLRMRESSTFPLRLRVFMASGIADLGQMTRTNDAMLELEGVKFYADGWLGARTCAVRRPFDDDPDNTGVLFLDSETLARRASPFADAGWTLATHAIGDRAISEVLDAYELIYGRDCSSFSPRIEHCQIFDAEIAERMAELGVVACIQPSFALSDQKVGRAALGDRMETAYRWEVLLDAGVKLITGSDTPIESLSPIQGLSDLVNANPRLQVSDALSLMTDATAGTTRLSADPATMEPSQLAAIKVLGTEVFT